MSDLRQAASFALTTLQGWKNYDHWLWPPSALGQAKQNTTEAISLLEVALAEPEIPSESPTDGELVDAYWEAWNECSKRENRDVHVAGLRAVYNLR